MSLVFLKNVSSGRGIGVLNQLRDGQLWLSPQTHPFFKGTKRSVVERSNKMSNDI